MSKSPGSFVFNVDQRKIAEPWKKPIVLLVTALLAAGSLGAAFVLAKKEDENSVKTQDDAVPKDAKIEDYSVLRVIQISTKSDPRTGYKVKVSSSVKGDDLQLVPASAGPKGDELRVDRSCDGSQSGFVRSEWQVLFPDKRQTRVLNGDVCFRYGDTMVTTLRFRHAQHGFGGYTLKGWVYDWEFVKPPFGSFSKSNPVPYVKEIQVTQEGWRSWWE